FHLSVQQSKPRSFGHDLQPPRRVSKQRSQTARMFGTRPIAQHQEAEAIGNVPCLLRLIARHQQIAALASKRQRFCLGQSTNDAPAERQWLAVEPRTARADAQLSQSMPDDDAIDPLTILP